MPPGSAEAPISARIAAAFAAACADELAALKPGNVHRHADGHGMSLADFEASAAAAAPAIARLGTSIGRRILDAVTATWDAVGCNTNLGIVLLCAPLAAAAESVWRSDDCIDAARLAAATSTALDALGVADAALAFRAIALANPGGLGEAPQADVHAPPAVTLKAAMQLAAGRDRIARQYAEDYADIFGFALPRLERGLARGLDGEAATTYVFLSILAAWPDSHLLRKFGDSVAQTVTGEARHFHDDFISSTDPDGLREELLDWDSRLKQRGLNPGTSADLTVATLFAHRLIAAEGP